MLFRSKIVTENKWFPCERQKPWGVKPQPTCYSRPPRRPLSRNKDRFPTLALRAESVNDEHFRTLASLAVCRTDLAAVHFCDVALTYFHHAGSHHHSDIKGPRRSERPSHFRPKLGSIAPHQLYARLKRRPPKRAPISSLFFRASCSAFMRRT